MTQIPFVITLVISTFHWNILHPKSTHFTGFNNFIDAAKDASIRAALINSVTLTTIVVVVSVLFGLGLAVLLDRKFRGRALIRTLIITPFLVTPVASALMWKHIIFNPLYGILDGFTTQIYKFFGGNHVIQTDYVSNHALLALALPMIWQWTPFMMLIILAGLQGQSPEILEAASVDGAGPWKMFTKMTVPHLRQYIQLACVLGTIYIIQSMDYVYTITQGGPGTDSTTIPYQIYVTMFQAYNYGEAAAAGVIVVLFTILLSTFALRLLTSLISDEK